MSDRHIVQKNINSVFQDYRASVLPNVVENWDAMNEDIRSNFIKENDFFCGLHFLVGLADQTEASLKAWDGYYVMIDQLVLLQMVGIGKVNLVHYG